MFPVYQYNGNHNSGCDYDRFVETFESICQEHRNSRRALLFAFILHDERNPYQVKILNDPDYWNALHKLSGNIITVFSLVRHEIHSTDTGTYGMNLMVKIDFYGTIEDPFATFKKRFKLADDPKLPGIVFFQVHEKKVIDAVYVKLIAKSTEAAYNEISQIIGLVTESVSEVKLANYRNSAVIFGLVRNVLSDRKVFRIARGIFKRSFQIKEFLSPFHQIVG